MLRLRRGLETKSLEIDGSLWQGRSEDRDDGKRWVGNTLIVAYKRLAEIGRREEVFRWSDVVTYKGASGKGT